MLNYMIVLFNTFSYCYGDIDQKSLSFITGEVEKRYL